ncbi:MAG: cell division protein FtsL [Lactobacillales bacterium]|jgi:cell division protein FtsL|nr:cell division protein FtsL [Lactobacillales bacterium]
MAERKMYHFDDDYAVNYDETYYQATSYSNYVSQVADVDDMSALEIEEIKQPNETIQHSVNPHNPYKRFNKITRLEKILFLTIVFVIISFAVSMIYVRTVITETTNEVTTIQGDISKKERRIEELKQQSTELLNAERVKKIAEEKGLSKNDDNIRTVK